MQYQTSINKINKISKVGVNVPVYSNKNAKYTLDIGRFSMEIAGKRGNIEGRLCKKFLKIYESHEQPTHNYIAISKHVIQDLEREGKFELHTNDICKFLEDLPALEIFSLDTEGRPIELVQICYIKNDKVHVHLLDYEDYNIGIILDVLITEEYSNVVKVVCDYNSELRSLGISNITNVHDVQDSKNKKSLCRMLQKELGLDYKIVKNKSVYYGIWSVETLMRKESKRYYAIGDALWTYALYYKHNKSKNNKG